MCLGEYIAQSMHMKKKDQKIIDIFTTLVFVAPLLLSCRLGFAGKPVENM